MLNSPFDPNAKILAHPNAKTLVCASVYDPHRKDVYVLTHRRVYTSFLRVFVLKG